MIIEFLKANWQSVLIVAAMVVTALPSIKPLLGGLLGKIGTIAPGITFGASENSRQAFIRARDTYRADLAAFGLPDGMVDQLVAEAAAGKGAKL